MCETPVLIIIIVIVIIIIIIVDGWVSTADSDVEIVKVGNSMGLTQNTS